MLSFEAMRQAMVATTGTVAEQQWHQQRAAGEYTRAVRLARVVQWGGCLAMAMRARGIAPNQQIYGVQPLPPEAPSAMGRLRGKQPVPQSKEVHLTDGWYAWDGYNGRRLITGVTLATDGTPMWLSRVEPWQSEERTGNLWGDDPILKIKVPLTARGNLPTDGELYSAGSGLAGLTHFLGDGTRVQRDLNLIPLIIHKLERGMVGLAVHHDLPSPPG